MRCGEQILRLAVQTAFDQGGLNTVCQLVAALLNGQEARHQAVAARLEARIAGGR